MANTAPMTSATMPIIQMMWIAATKPIISRIIPSTIMAVSLALRAVPARPGVSLKALYPRWAHGITEAGSLRVVDGAERAAACVPFHRGSDGFSAHFEQSMGVLVHYEFDCDIATQPLGSRPWGRLRSSGPGEVNDRERAI